MLFGQRHGYLPSESIPEENPTLNFQTDLQRIDFELTTIIYYCESCLMNPHWYNSFRGRKLVILSEAL